MSRLFACIIFEWRLVFARFHSYFCDSIHAFVIQFMPLRFHYLCDFIDILASFWVTYPTCGVDSVQIFSSTFA